MLYFPTEIIERRILVMSLSISVITISFTLTPPTVYLYSRSRSFWQSLVLFDSHSFILTVAPFPSF